MPRNYLAQDLLIEADRRNPWTRKGLAEICDHAFADNLIVLVSTPGVPVVLEQKTTILWKYLYLLAALEDSLGLGEA